MKKATFLLSVLVAFIGLSSFMVQPPAVKEEGKVSQQKFAPTVQIVVGNDLQEDIDNLTFTSSLASYSVGTLVAHNKTGDDLDYNDPEDVIISFDTHTASVTHFYMDVYIDNVFFNSYPYSANGSYSENIPLSGNQYLKVIFHY